MTTDNENNSSTLNGATMHTETSNTETTERIVAIPFDPKPTTMTMEVPNVITMDEPKDVSAWTLYRLLCDKLAAMSVSLAHLEESIIGRKYILTEERDTAGVTLRADKPSGHVAVRFKAARKRAGKTQAQAAKAMGMPGSYLSLLESGIRDVTPVMAKRMRTLMAKWGAK